MHLRIQKKWCRLAAFCLVIASAGILFVVLQFYYNQTVSERIVINEVCSSNFSIVCDENGNYSDYVELYNPSGNVVSLDGFFLSDEKKDLKKYSLDGVTLPARGYALIWLDGSENQISNHASFRLSKDGGELFLSNQEGEIVDSVIVPALSYNTSYARAGNDKEWQYMSATPGEDNAEGQVLCGVMLDKPAFSKESGFYDDEFLLELSSVPDTEIYYTLDGSEPDVDSILYEEPIFIGDASQNDNIYAARTDLAPSSTYAPSEKVDKGTVVRAISYDSKNNAISETVTKSYFVGFSRKEEYASLPIISLVSDPDNLFDPEYGIYTNGVAMEEYKAKGGLQDGELLSEFTSGGGTTYYRYMSTNAVNRGKEWEREANIIYFDENHRFCFSQDVGIRIAGQSTRGAAQKSLNVFGRDIYSEKAELQYAFFDDMSYSSIKLRNGGSDNTGSKIMDAFLQSLVQDRAVSTQASMPCVVFLNGEYWGIYNIREKYKEEYFNNHYGVVENNIWLIDSGNVSIGTSAAMDAYEYMLDFVSQNDMSVQENYENACNLLDVQSLIDFYCINLYIDNMDVSFGQNIAMWRTKWQENNGFGDGRWRWALYDMDSALTSYDNNTFQNSVPWQEDFDLMDEQLVSSLMANEQFKKQFCLSFMDVANVNYTYNHVHDSLMEWKENYQTQVVKSHQRFIREDFSNADYETLINGMDDFFRKRFAFITNCLSEELGLNGSLETVRISVNHSEGGKVLLNTSLIEPDPEWSGQYFTDYPITVMAVPNEGWHFVGWSGNITSQQEQQEVDVMVGGVTLKAEFERVEE